ncbi:MAG: hypothetical protein LUD81_07920 [Clostridiales bacterium]|nr:hypothetical protein [Clostridiales bacterium]
MVKNGWLDKARAKFKKGDRVIAEVRFGDYINTKILEGIVDGVYRDFIVVSFEGTFRQCYKWHDIYAGKVSPVKG